jgi:hypothetical protein
LDLIKGYYSDFQLRFTANDFVTEWHKLEVGIITGCTISVILFATAMNLISKSAEAECRGPVTLSGMRQPPIRAFMDDLTVTTKAVTGARWLLTGIQDIISWARMEFKPTKSRSLVVKNGKVTNKYRFRVADIEIPTITEKPVKSLGKVFDSSLSDKDSIKQTTQQLTDWLSTIDRSGLPGKFKAWIYQHGLLPRILWPLLVYEFTMTTIDEYERKISGYIRRWLGLPRSLSSIALYGKSNKLQLPFSSIAEEYKVTKVREVLQYRDSRDEKVSGAGIRVRTGRKWDAQEAVNEAESRLRHSVIVGRLAKGRTGLGSNPAPHWDTGSKKERHQLVQDQVRTAIEETRQCKTVSMSQQGRWTRWESVQSKKITWTELWNVAPQRIKFLVQAVYDVLPTPTNLMTWGKIENSNCSLCGKPGNLEHILSSCSKALADGRYRWRHDTVLREIAAVIDNAMKSTRGSKNKKAKFISFVKAGEKIVKEHHQLVGLLHKASDWNMIVDLEKQLQIPQDIVETRLRPDIVLLSRSTKQLVFIELTVPWEERAEEAHERKRLKYDELVEQCRAKGWSTRCDAVEVGCRGFICQSLWNTFRTLGIVGTTRKKATRSISDVAEKSSRWLWIKRAEGWASR